MRLRRSAVIALAALLPALMGGSGGGCSSSSSSSGGSSGPAAPPPKSSASAAKPAPGGNPQQSAPAEAQGGCQTEHGLENLSEYVTGTLDWTCTGAALLVVHLRLLWLDPSTGLPEIEAGGVDNPGGVFEVNSVTSTKPARITAPCKAGKWKMSMVGTVTGAGGEIVLNSNDKKQFPTGWDWVDIAC